MVTPLSCLQSSPPGKPIAQGGTALSGVSFTFTKESVVSAKDMNQVILRGRLADDPVIRDVSNGGSQVANLTVATGHVVGEREITDWIRCSAWNYLADTCRDLRKGDLVLVLGRLRISSWTDNDGNKRNSTEVNVENIAYLGSARSSMPKPVKSDEPFPFVDRTNGISWPEPDKEGYSRVKESNKELCAEWKDSSDPSQGGFMYELVEDESEGMNWQLLGDIPANANMPQ